MEDLRMHFNSTKTQMDFDFDSKLQKLDVKNIVETQDQIVSELNTLKAARKEFEQDFNNAMQSSRDKKKSKKPSYMQR